MGQKLTINNKVSGQSIPTDKLSMYEISMLASNMSGRTYLT